MIQIHLQPLKILGGWRRRRASDLQGAATGDQVLNLCPYHIFGDTSSPEVLSYFRKYFSYGSTCTSVAPYFRESTIEGILQYVQKYESTKVLSYFRKYESTKVRRYESTTYVEHMKVFIRISTVGLSIFAVVPS